MGQPHLESVMECGLFPDRKRSGEERWHVLHVMSRQEKALVKDMTSVGADCFLPILKQVTYRRGRKSLVEGPLFPGYAFLWGTVDDAYVADRTRRVVNLIRVTDQEELERELGNLHRALSLKAQLKPVRLFQRGVRVQVAAGPFKGIEGVVTRLTGGGRLVLGVSMLGSAVSLEVEESLLVRV